jgi:hypothetical protein
MDIQLLINTMQQEEIKELINLSNQCNTEVNINTNSNMQTCNCTNNDDLYSQHSSEYNKDNKDNKDNCDGGDCDGGDCDGGECDEEDCRECECESGDDCYCYDDEYEDAESNSDKKTLIYYYEDDDMHNEEINYNYHINKNFGNWQYAKMIISHSYNDKQATEFFWDYIEAQFNTNNDSFDNIIKIYYKNDLDLGIIYEFENEIAKYVVDNLKIQSYKPKGYIFNGDENQNKWAFKIVVITSKCIYTANRYITDNIIGFY